MNDEQTRMLAPALGRIPSGLFILTAGDGKSETGMLVSWVQQCAFQPPRVSVAINSQRGINAWLNQGANFILNILSEDQTDMIAHFGRGYTLTEPAFTGLELMRGANGLPVLSDALGYLECRVTGRFPAGDHDLLIADVVAGRMLTEGEPMVHVRKTGMKY
jgi:flavin reductase (DIM6/NTAB) family NADH-FMN oxidoreductase RutF